MPNNKIQINYAVKSFETVVDKSNTIITPAQSIVVSKNILYPRMFDK